MLMPVDVTVPGWRYIQPRDLFGDRTLTMMSCPWVIGGTLSIDFSEKPGMALALNRHCTQTCTYFVPMRLLHVRTSADKVYSPSTEWVPNWQAMDNRLQPQSNSYIFFAAATPLASTLKPQFSIMWQLLLVANAGRTLQYGWQYEMRWELCRWKSMNNSNCANDNEESEKVPRVRWYEKADFIFDKIGGYAAVYGGVVRKAFACPM